jgi:thiol-disulfide isomerase/thioredoxin
MSKRFPGALAALLVGALAAPAQELNVGDPAPKLDVKEFVKGDAVAGLEKGKTYVLEFWATWCGPCRTSIPHVTELQKKHKDVVFLGVSVWEQKPEGVKPFVEEMGDKMDYRVALDAVAAGAKGGDGAMAKTWMQAAGEQGIPAAFIVNKDGVIAWIGHPMQMDKPLDEVVAGKWDVQVARAERTKEQARQQKLQELQGKILAAQRGGKTDEALEVIDKAVAEDPAMEQNFAMMKLRLLTGKGGNPEKAAAYIGRLTDDVFKDNAQALNFVAWSVVDPDAQAKPDKKLVELALKAARRADELAQGKDGAIADTLAKAYFDSGDTAKALETQERAAALVKGTPQEKDPGIQKRLEEYRKAANKQ